MRRKSLEGKEMDTQSIKIYYHECLSVSVMKLVSGYLTKDISQFHFVFGMFYPAPQIGQVALVGCFIGT